MTDRTLTLGVLGGMGALASARFISTLYQENPAPTEQEQPIVLLRSNPHIPDRTRALLEGRREALASALTAELDALFQAGADRAVICCFTAHVVWSDLPHPLRTRTLSLLDVLFSAPTLATRRRLVLCTEGSRRLGLFTEHPGFTAHRDHLVFADEAGQATVHQLIYALKRGATDAEVLPALEALARDAGAEGFVAGCTELHLLGALPDGLDCVDPLRLIAQNLPELLRAEARSPVAPNVSVYAHS